MKKAISLLLIVTISVLSFQILSMPIANGKPRIQRVKPGQKEANQRQKARKVHRERIIQGI